MIASNLAGNLILKGEAQSDFQYSMWPLVPRIKVVISIILPASTRNKLKFSLKVAFMFLAIILKWQVSNGDIFLVIRKKGD